MWELLKDQIWRCHATNWWKTNKHRNLLTKAAQSCHIVNFSCAYMTIEKKRMLGHNDPRSLRIFEPSGLLNVAQEINEGTHLVNSPASQLASLHSDMSHSLRTNWNRETQPSSDYGVLRTTIVSGSPLKIVRIKRFRKHIPTVKDEQKLTCFQ